DVGDVAARAPVNGCLPSGGVRGQSGVPVRVALARLRGHVHAQGLELLRDEGGVLPVVGEAYRIVDREGDDLAALGPAVGRVAAVAVSARLVRPGGAVIEGGRRRGPAAAREDVIDVVPGGHLGSLGGRRIRDVP